MESLTMLASSETLHSDESANKTANLDDKAANKSGDMGSAQCRTYQLCQPFQADWRLVGSIAPVGAVGPSGPTKAPSSEESTLARTSAPAATGTKAGPANTGSRASAPPAPSISWSDISESDKMAGMRMRLYPSSRC
ncbi:hypothetical protein OUZ56_003551 [Daphnia magna]|uniref:Uncharacterized protein n=1 Tax=Daphnia magna TaxID=35525 RepID=A0ABR0A9G4_9CRUS|nr:hypothetical protein OUZ56_003551 [Daphnia magna]